MTHPEERAEIVTAVLRRHGRILLCHRSPHRQHFPNRWAFPGGNVEVGEAAEQALARELAEELGITVAPPTHAPAAVIDTDAFHLRTWLIESWSGTPANTAPEEHDDLIWVDLDEARDLDLAHPEFDYPLLVELLGGPVSTP
ncbi:NUDIX domain-containing protein [Kineosporia sp. J2-2]|uniref:NUDIX domain-containing protein n=1 Tax=Kineosporia corallincola TaxID=2835133 RepID=A0ABS5TTS8_9ACTN|nr:NUDIX domain-containing protein [Kineosporia corallincola]MBT0774202.1 NUDIX domain-containing protein [Kineosporia corallincola]